MWAGSASLTGAAILVPHGSSLPAGVEGWVTGGSGQWAVGVRDQVFSTGFWGFLALLRVPSGRVYALSVPADWEPIAFLPWVSQGRWPVPSRWEASVCRGPEVCLSP